MLLVFVLVMPFMLAMVMMVIIDIDHFTMPFFPAGSGDRRTRRAANAGANNCAIAPADCRTHRRACRAAQSPADHGIAVNRRCRYGPSRNRNNCCH